MSRIEKIIEQARAEGAAAERERLETIIIKNTDRCIALETELTETQARLQPILDAARGYADSNCAAEGIWRASKSEDMFCCRHLYDCVTCNRNKFAALLKEPE